MNDAKVDEQDLWPRGWDGHEAAQRRRMAQLSLYDKIGWLEDAQELVWSLQASRAAREASKTTPPDGAITDQGLQAPERTTE